jgi:hypothetical protein
MQPAASFKGIGYGGCMPLFTSSIELNPSQVEDH